MSRSNPNENRSPNPATRWYEWNGEHGVVRYYDKDTKQNVDMKGDFLFLLLDELGSVRGWDNRSDSGIYSNEVKDSSQEVMIVRSFKGGTLAEGRYRSIKDKVNALGGHYVANCYIAVKNGGEGLSIASLRFKGAALGAWMEFRKANKADLFKKAIIIRGFDEGKHGRIVYRTPKFLTKDISPESDALAFKLDQQLQEFLTAYLKRPKREQAESHDDEDALENELPPDDPVEPLTDDDIPFAWMLPLALPLTGTLALFSSWT